MDTLDIMNAVVVVATICAILFIFSNANTRRTRYDRE